RAMNSGPLTFQCACFACSMRSMLSARRAFSGVAILVRVGSGRSFLVFAMVVPCSSSAGADAAQRRFEISLGSGSSCRDAAMIATLREMRQSPPLRDASGTPEGRAQPADWQILDAEKVLGIEGEPEVPRLEKTFQEKERGRP